MYKLQDDVFQFLDSIRPTDIVSMFDTVPALTDIFEIQEPEARQYVSLWLRTFSERHLAKQHLAKQKVKELELA